MNTVLNRVFRAKVEQSEDIARGVKKLTFVMDSTFNFIAGQYVWVEIPILKENDPKGNRRAFSIFNIHDRENTIEIIARISESAYKQQLFELNTGDEVIIHGPFGSAFVVDEDNYPQNIIMIAGGVGIAAFKPVLEAIRTRSIPMKCYLVYVNNDSESTPNLKELDLLKSNGIFDYKVKYEKFTRDDIKALPSPISSTTQWWIAGPQG